MSVFGTVVIGKRETLSRPGALGRGEAALDWPDQGTAERNWALNGALLDRMIAAGGPIRDADVHWGILVSHSGFLARERERMRGAGLAMGEGGHWRRPQRRFLKNVARVLLNRARAAAARGAHTFAVPEAAPLAAWIASRTPDVGLQARAVAWLLNGTPYHGLVRLCAAAAQALDGASLGAQPVFRAKAAGELEPMLSLWPDVLVLPLTMPLTVADLIELRPFPVHPLGLVAQPSWADGDLLTPSEYFFHDLDHARFKVRESLLARGVEIPDAYRDGTTVDARTGTHRMILSRATVPLRSSLGGFTHEVDRGRRLLDRMRRLRCPTVRAASQLLLFELVHEKSLPLDPAVLSRASTAEAEIHLAKLWRKYASGFFGAAAPSLEVMNALPGALATLAAEAG